MSKRKIAFIMKGPRPKVSMHHVGKGNTFIRVMLLPNARKGNYRKDLINFEIKSKTHHVAGDMTETEALILADGLLHAAVMKMEREKKL